MTFDEARLMANVNARADALFQNGYRARWAAPALLLVRNASGATYRVDTAARTCTCPFFRGWDGRYPCKHLLGWKRLLVRQRRCRRLAALVLLSLWRDLDDAAPLTPCGEVPAFAAGADYQKGEY